MANPGIVTNPTGKGGFGDHPENSLKGRWSKENSQHYCLNKFLSMTEEEFLTWAKENPPEKRTVAQILAYERVAQSRKTLADYKEVIDRTEGQAKQKIEFDSSNDEAVDKLDELIKELRHEIKKG